jgi:hypothetical protein
LAEYFSAADKRQPLPRIKLTKIMTGNFLFIFFSLLNPE